RKCSKGRTHRWWLPTRYEQPSLPFAGVRPLPDRSCSGSVSRPRSLRGLPLLRGIVRRRCAVSMEPRTVFIHDLPPDGRAPLGYGHVLVAFDREQFLITAEVDEPAPATHRLARGDYQTPARSVQVVNHTFGDLPVLRDPFLWGVQAAHQRLPLAWAFRVRQHRSSPGQDFCALTSSVSITILRYSSYATCSSSSRFFISSGLTSRAL